MKSRMLDLFSASFFLSCILLNHSVAQEREPLDVTRPPQFVLLAYDGSKSLNSWSNTRSYAREMTAAGKPVKYTYFISGVYFLSPANKSLYDAPIKGPGISAIGFGKSPLDIGKRIDQVNAAFKEGHEIASHANGHFSSNTWTEANWQSEFSQFNSLVFDAAKNNGISKKFGFTEKEIVGYRSPELSYSSGLWPTLRANYFLYDTTKVNEATYWPEKSIFGIWNFQIGRAHV